MEEVVEIEEWDKEDIQEARDKNYKKNFSY